MYRQSGLHIVSLVAITALAVTLGACGGVDTEQMEAEKLEQMELTNEQRIIAEALIAGQKKETGIPVLRSRDYAAAGCYAKTVQVSRGQSRAHEAYLRDYAEADKDFYAWFKRQGVGEQEAYAISQAVHAALDECSLGSLLKGRLRS
jgi:hypothetical protein